MKWPPPPLSFRLLGIPVVIELGFFLIPLLGTSGLGPQRGAAWVAIVLLSVMLHELGHALAMRSFGFAPSIRLHMMGGLTFWPEGAAPTWGRRLVVSLSGPLLELASGITALVWVRTMPVQPSLVWAISSFGWVNIVWAIVNLLPVLPWDGGHSLDAFLAIVTGRSQRTVVGTVSVVVGGLVVLAALWQRSLMLGYFGVVGVQHGLAYRKVPKDL